MYRLATIHFVKERRTDSCYAAESAS